MINIEKTEVYGWQAAIRGMRNPMNSWDKSDSEFNIDYRATGMRLGANDLDLARKLTRAGSDHRKFLRQIFVSVDISAPLYWWKEFDTYKVGTVANSTSTMHKVHASPFTRADFSHDRMTEDALAALDALIAYLEGERLAFVETNDRAHWHNIIQLLPSSYMQLRTVTLNYEVLINIYHARKNHKLDEWRTLCKWIESLPYSELITMEVAHDG